jgi:site-specific recombinase XerD
MTLESVVDQECGFLESCESVDLYEIGEVPCLYNPVESQNQVLETRKSDVKDPCGSPESKQLQRLLEGLEQMQFVGKGHLEEYLRDQYRRGCRANTMRNSTKGIELFLTRVTKNGKTDVEQIVREDIFQFIEEEQNRGLKPRTVLTRLRAIKAFLRFLINQELIDPRLLTRTITVKVPDTLPRAMDPEDVKKLLEVKASLRDRAMVLVLLRTGMRIGELLDIKLQDVHLKERRIEIYEAVKNRVGRVVYLSDDAHGALKKWFKKRDLHKELVFYGMGRTFMTYQGARLMFKRYLAKAGLADSGYTLHCLRHTFASELLNAGMRLECVQQLLGHSNIEMTRRYARLTDKTREEEYFRAMSVIERGEIDGHYQLDHQLQEILEKKELLRPNGQELHERP